MTDKLLEQGKQALEKLPENYLPFIVRWLELITNKDEAEIENFWLLASKVLKSDNIEQSGEWKTYFESNFPEQIGTWHKIREHHPQTWLVVEALDGKTINNIREINSLRVCGIHGNDWKEAWENYKELRRANKNRELFVIHTDREVMDIEVIGLGRNES